MTESPADHQPQGNIVVPAASTPVRSAPDLFFSERAVQSLEPCAAGSPGRLRGWGTRSSQESGMAVLELTREECYD